MMSFFSYDLTYSIESRAHCIVTVPKRGCLHWSPHSWLWRKIVLWLSIARVA